MADGSAMSTVTIQNPTPAHSGKYACRPANLEPAYVNLHVIQGKQSTNSPVSCSIFNIEYSICNFHLVIKRYPIIIQKNL